MKYNIDIILPNSFNNKLPYPVIYILDPYPSLLNLYKYTLKEYLYQFESFEEFILIGIGPKVKYINNIRKERAKIYLPAKSKLKWRNKSNFKKTIINKNKKFIEFFKKTIFYLENKYKILVKKRIIIGVSFSGLFCLDLLNYYPNLFDIYLVCSPSLYWDTGFILNSKPLINNNILILIYFGDKESDKLKYYITKFYNHIKKTNINIKIYIKEIINETHKTIKNQFVSKSLIKLNSIIQ